ncbi:MAG: hypothetical protein WEF86_11635 [Gemmatimonadota bacterium]
MHDNASQTKPTTRRARIDVERLRELTQERSQQAEASALPDILQQKQEELTRQREERMRRLREKFESHSEPQAHDTIDSSRIDDVAERPPQAAKPERSMVKRRKEYLEPKQHARLRDQIEHLWAVDKRFRNWSLLARAAGLSSGQAVKRAYEVNSSMATLRNIDTFARLHAGFGSRATRALKTGVPVSELQGFLTGASAAGDAAGAVAGAVAGAGAGAGAGAVAGAVAGARGRAPRTPAVTMETLGETPPTVDFAGLVELGHAVDTEVKRLWLVAKFFEDVARKAELPRTVRDSAARARRYLLEAVDLFAGSAADDGSGERVEAAGGAPATPSVH